MLLSFEKTCGLIAGGATLHIAGTGETLKKLPIGNWIGGSTEYFMAKEGGIITNELLFVTEFPDMEFKIASYDTVTMQNVTLDAFENGFSIVIIPFGSGVHNSYARSAPEYKDMFIKNIVGWISGVNLNVPGQTALAVNGQTGDVSPDKAAALHIRVPDDKLVNIGIVNLFEQDEATPVIEFDEDGFSAVMCRVNGKPEILADYVAKNNIDTRLPLVGEYSGAGVNISFKDITDGIVNFYAPVFKDIKYRIAKPVSDYAAEFQKKIADYSETAAVFSCNCILNFLYGELESRQLDMFHGPVTFGEIAYQLVNQTMVYAAIV